VNRLLLLASVASTLCLLVTTRTSTGSVAPPTAVVATFDVGGEQFRVWVANQQTVQQLRDLAAGESNASIPAGDIHPGPGQAAHNLPWSWHLDPVVIQNG